MTDAERNEKAPVNAFWGNIFSKIRPGSPIPNLEVLRHCPLFQRLGDREIKKLSSLIYERRYQAGEYLFEKGQPGTAMFIVRFGHVKIVVPGSGDDEKELAEILPNDFFGEIALLDDTPRSASARAVETTEALAFYREDLNEMMGTYPAIASKILRELAVIIGHRLKKCNEQLLDSVL